MYGMSSEPWAEGAACFPQHWQPTAVHPVQGGLSGGMVWKIETPAGKGALRRWSNRFTPERIATIHRLMEHAGKNGCDFIPTPIASRDGRTCIPLGGYNWDLCTWMEGEPLSTEPEGKLLQVGVQAIARWHQATPHVRFPLGALDSAELVAAMQAGQMAPCPAWLRRKQEWSRLVPRVLAADARHAVGVGDLFHRTQRAIREVWDAFDYLFAQSVPMVPLRICLRDVHRDHVLFTGDKVTGIIDFGAIGIDSAACDLARFLGSAVPDRPHLWEQALQAYVQCAPLSDVERQWTFLLDWTGTLIGVLRWADWLTSLELPQRQAAIARWERLLGRVESWLEQKSGPFQFLRSTKLL